MTCEKLAEALSHILPHQQKQELSDAYMTLKNMDYHIKDSVDIYSPTTHNKMLHDLTKFREEVKKLEDTAKVTIEQNLAGCLLEFIVGEKI